MSAVIAQLSAALSDHYRIERELGAGGMATVYLAHDLKHDRKVAIKVLESELSAVLGTERFVQEIKTTAQLTHPHILPLFDSGEAAGFLYYVMPFIEGETIRDKLKRETQLGVAEAVRIAREVADALDYAHRRGVIHRDIKPGNILLHDGRAMVMDFGIALAVSAAAGGRMTETGLSLGTPHYMSPEQAAADRDITGRSDVYSLATVLYEMLTGEPPHTGATAQAIMMKIITEPVADVTTLRKSVPPNVTAALAHALEKLPADRFETGKAFAEALANPAFAAATVGGFRPTSLDVPSLRWWMGSPWSWAALATLGIAVTFAGLATRRPGEGTRLAYVAQTFVPRAIFNGRFAPDGQTIVFSGTPGAGNTPHLFVVRPEHPDPQPFGPDSTHLLSVSSTGVAAVLTHARYLGHRLFSGTLATLPLSGGAPRELTLGVREADWAPDGQSMAVVRDTGGVDLLEYPVGTVLARAPGYLSDVRVSPSGDAVAYFEHPARFDNRGAVVIVDRSGRVVARAQDFPNGLEGMAWRPDGSAVLFAGAATRENASVERAGYRLDRSGRLRRILSGPGSITILDVDPAGRLLIGRDDEPGLLMVRGPGAREEANLGVGAYSVSGKLSPDGRQVVFSDQSPRGGPNYTVLLRRTDGSPEIRLGEGRPIAFSPDGRFVLAIVPSSPPRVLLYPTGPGESRQLDSGTFESITFWNGSLAIVDGDLRYLFCGAQQGQRSRCYLGSVRGGTPAPVTPEGAGDVALLSPDGTRVLARVNGVAGIYPVNGGTPRPVQGLKDDDHPIRWSPNGQDLWVWYQGDSLIIRIDRLNPETGNRAELTRIVPRDRAGLMRNTYVDLADDPRVFSYSQFRRSSTLYTVEGVR